VALRGTVVSAAAIMLIYNSVCNATKTFVSDFFKINVSLPLDVLVYIVCVRIGQQCCLQQRQYKHIF